MGIRRSDLSFDEQYTQVPNEWARDPRLSRRARGLLVEIMSHRVGWHVTIRSLAKSGKEGRDAIQTALAELLEHGYVRRMQGRAVAGKFAEIEYELCEPPAVAGFPVHGSPVSGSAVSGESATKKNITSEDHLSEDQLSIVGGVAELDLDAAFDLIWNLWPTPRRATTKVVRAKLAAAEKVVGLEVVVDAVRRDVAVWRGWPAQDVQYVPLLTTWLHQGRWEPQAAAQPRGGRMTAVDAGRAADAILAERERRAVTS